MKLNPSLIRVSHVGFSRAGFTSIFRGVPGESSGEGGSPLVDQGQQGCAPLSTPLVNLPLGFSILIMRVYPNQRLSKICQIFEQIKNISASVDSSAAVTLGLIFTSGIIKSEYHLEINLIKLCKSKLKGDV